MPLGVGGMTSNNNNITVSGQITSNIIPAINVEDVNNVDVLENEESNKRLKIDNDKFAKAVPTITPEHRATRLKRLELENEILRQRLSNREKMIEMNNKSAEDQAIKNNRYGVLIGNDTENIVMDTSTIDEPNINTFDSIKKAIKRKNSAPISINTDSEPRVNVTNKNVNDKTTNTSTSNLEKKTPKPPPIHIHGQSIKDTITLVKGLDISKFEIRRVSTNKHSVFLENIDEYQKLKGTFNETNTKYFSYTPKDSKPKTLVLKGLTEDEDIEDLRKEIEHKCAAKINNISQLKTKHSRDTNRKLPLYLVQFSPNTMLNSVYNLKSINYQRITWETLDKKQDMMQCKNCQRFNHSAANCHLDYRCVKCAEHHKPGECPIKEKTESTTIYCINCKNSGHPASYKGCPVYQQTLQKLRQKISEKRKNLTIPRQFISTPVNAANGSYAEVLNANNHNNNTSNITTQDLVKKVDQLAKIVQQQSEQISQLLNLINHL